ncbi:N-acetylneuraminate synthase family protein [Patescibacteria group bacterium]|nr:N-acetylneuraminate synthase family protein [Patescibacteria group bacterium]
MKEIKIGKISISENGPTVIIAEAACEHRGNMDSAKRLIRSAKDSGADIVKFQLHLPEFEMVPGAVKFWAGSMDDVLREVNFEKYEQHKELKEYCEKIGIQYLCTPFCSKAADVLEKVGVDGFKIGSGELTNLSMMRHLARKKRPIIISTGMSTIEEIAETVKVLKEEKAEFAILHCVSEYPAKYEHLNLGMIRILKEKFGVITGFSDHTNEIYSAISAVALGAKIIEKHFTIRDFHGPDDLVSLAPEQFKQMVDGIRKIEVSLGTERKVSKEEQVVRDWAFHSVVAFCDIKQGEEFTLENLIPKRPGSGIEAKYLDQIYSAKLLGRKAKRDLAKDTILQWEDVI